MNYFKQLTVIISLGFAVVFTVSCKEKSSAETTEESVTATQSTYKEATFIEPAEFDKGRRKKQCRTSGCSHATGIRTGAH